MLQVSVLCHSYVILSCDVMVTCKLSEILHSLSWVHLGDCVEVTMISNRDSYASLWCLIKEGVRLNKGSLIQTRVAIRSL